ncbi:GreA/GreB family elongation factor [Myxococcota bacterium]|nr:GreA/GreB family elongation factor [Myxococcota bacterium]
MSVNIDKDAVVAALRAALEAELAAVEAVAAMARDEVGSDQSKAEGKYDTRATEASYLARGQAWRIDELQRLRAWFEVLAPTPRMVAEVGALVELVGPRRDLVFLAPVGGASAEVGGRTVRVISPSSPLGQALAELEAGDGFEVDSPAGEVSWEIAAIW